MSNYVVVTPAQLIAPVGAVCTNAQAAFPAVNVMDGVHPYRAWKSSTYVSGTTRIAIDLGASLPIAAVFIDHINAPTVAVEWSTDNASWTTYATVTPAADVLDGRTKYFQVLTAVTARYIGIRGSGTLTDGSNAMKCGGITACSALTTLTNNPSGDYTRTSLMAVRQNNDFGGGGSSPVKLGERHGEIQMSAPVMPLSSEADLFTLFGAIGEHQPFVFYRNQGKQSEAYMVYRVGTVAVSMTGPNSLSFSGGTLRGAI